MTTSILVSKVKNKISNPGIRFLLLVIGLYLIWDFLFRTLLVESEMSYAICEFLGWTASSLFSWLGYSPHWENQTLHILGKPVVYIGVSCNGLEFFGLFACFVLAFPAHWRSKIPFLILGILAIHILNTIRVQLLAINVYFYSASFEFNHKYTFNVIIYGSLLLLWMVWAKKQMPKSHVG